MYDAPIGKDHAGTTDLLDIWFHLNSTWDDPSWQVVTHYSVLCKNPANETSELRAWTLNVAQGALQRQMNMNKHIKPTEI